MQNQRKSCCCCSDSCFLFCCCCLQVKHKCRAAGPFCGEGESDACTSRSNVGQRGKKALEWPLTPPLLVFYNSNGQPTALMIFWPFLCTESLHSRQYITLSKLTISMTLNDTVTCSKGWRGQTLHWSGTLALICQSAQLVLLGSTARKPLKRPPPKNAPLCWQGKTTKHQHNNLLTLHR